MAKFDKGTRVELLPQCEGVYPRALGLSRGIVRDANVDEDGFERVLIEWDKNDWRFNHEEDGWTFADHFRAIDDPNREILEAEDYDVPMLVPTDEESEEEAKINRYIDAITTACDAAAESDAFFFITLKRDPENKVYLQIMSATTDEELLDLPSADIFSFVEEELRRRGQA